MIEVYKKFFLMLGVTVVLCLSASVVWSENVLRENLIHKNGLTYKPSSNTPYTGSVSGIYGKGYSPHWAGNQPLIANPNQDEKLIEIGQYKDGKKDGIWQTFSSIKMKLVWRGRFHKGKLKGQADSFYKNGQIYLTKNYYNDILKGSWIRYRRDGKKWEEGKYINSKREGIWTYYHKNGQLKDKGQYKDDLKEGSWVKYYKNGKLNYKGNYKNGKKNGSWVTYWENGQLWSKGYFKKNKREGHWVSFEDNGKVFKRYSGTYKDGKRISD